MGAEFRREGGTDGLFFGDLGLSFFGVGGFLFSDLFPVSFEWWFVGCRNSLDQEKGWLDCVFRVFPVNGLRDLGFEVEFFAPLQYLFNLKTERKKKLCVSFRRKH